MEKYGVEEDKLEEKKASVENRCPDCGSILRDVNETGVLVCPKCGTKPFEES